MTIRILPQITVTLENCRRTAQKVRRYAMTGSAEQEAQVSRIAADVKRRGDTAIIDYTRKFDRARLTKRQLRVSQDELVKATKHVNRKVANALRFSLQRLSIAQMELLSKLNFSVQIDGFKLRLTPKPLTSVGCYIPGGRAVYPSTVVMTAGLARLAGVERIVVCTPPNSMGCVNDAILAASELCGVDEVYRCGGAQAIAALTYGTKIIPKVDKIVGPGGNYVALAKRHVARDIATDFAGPTEMTVAVDETSNARLAAWDLVAQAEHGEDCLVNLVAVSKNIASDVREEINRILPSVARRNFVEASLRRGVTAICQDWQTACNFINELGPEHLELLTENRRQLAETIKSAGLILLGEFAPAAGSDYCIGTDHVLPTSGFAVNHSGLSILDFLKLTWTVEGTREGLRAILDPLKAMALTEGLPNHYLSVKTRFRE
jgi:histidinol dehydrogenase